MKERLEEVYKDLEQAVENQEEEKTERLVNLLAEEKGFTEEIRMPKDFTKQLQSKKGRKVMAKKSNMVKAAAAGLAAVCALGGTAYAATHWDFNEAKFTPSGIMSVNKKNQDENVKVTTEDGGIAVSQDGVESQDDTKTQVATTTILVDDDSSKEQAGDENTEVLEEQNGTKETNWSYKKVELAKSPIYAGEGTEAGQEETKEIGESQVKTTTYTYDSWEKLMADKVLPDFWNEKAVKGYSLDESKITSKEYKYSSEYEKAEDTKQREDSTIKSVSAAYKKGDKKIELNCMKEDYSFPDIEEEDAEYTSVSSLMTTDGQTIENQYYYTTKNQVKYALQDVKKGSEENTTAFLSGNGYTVTITFTNLPEDEMHQVLENINATALLEKTEK